MNKRFAVLLLAGLSVTAQAQNEKRLCQSLDQRLSSVDAADCTRLPGQSTGTSAGGQPLMRMDYPVSGEDGPRVLMIGPLDGQLLTGISTLYQWQYAIQGRERIWHWRVLPAPNPDGVLARPATRSNADGRAVTAGQQKDTTEEGQWLINEIRTFDPDLVVLMTGHQNNGQGVVRSGQLTGLAARVSNRMRYPVVRVRPDSKAYMPSDQAVHSSWAGLRDRVARLMTLIVQEK